MERRAVVSRQRVAQRARQDGDFTDAQWQDVLARYDYRCAYCGEAVTPLIQEHQVPVSRGGLHTLSNIVPACGPCNTSKGNLTAEEYAERLRLRPRKPPVRRAVLIGIRDPNVLTERQAAELLGVTVTHVRRLIGRGVLRRLDGEPELAGTRGRPAVPALCRDEVERYARERRPRGRPGKEQQ